MSATFVMQVSSFPNTLLGTFFPPFFPSQGAEEISTHQQALLYLQATLLLTPTTRTATGPYTLGPIIT